MKRHRHVLQYINQHFKVKLILSLSVIIIVCSAGTGYVSYRMNLTLFESEISKQYLKTNEQTIEQIGYKIQDIYRITDFVFFHPLVEQIVQRMHAAPDAQESEAYRSFMLERELASILLPLKNETPQIRAIYIIDLEGNNLYYSHSAPSIQINFPEFSKTLYSEIRQSSSDILWKRTKIPDTSEPTGEKSSIVAARLLKSTKQQTVYGMMLLIMDEAFFSDSLDPLMTGKTTGAYLYDQYNRLLFSRVPDGEAGIEPETDRLDGMFTQRHGKEDFLFVRSTYEPRTFTLVSGISLADVMARGRSVYQLALISGLVSILLMAISVSFFSGKLLRPLHGLVRAMQRVREGNLRESIPRTSDDEFAFLADSFNRMVEDIQKLIQEVYVSKLSEKEAELKALQAQINPHFLYNALNSIYWKIVLLYDDDETASLVTSLSNLLKYSLASISTPSTLQDELTQIRHYIRIQEARYGEQLHVTIEADEEAERCKMQRLLLQPLVENVFIHAFRDQASDKRLWIRVRRADQELIIEIEDNGCGIDPHVLRHLLEDQDPSVQEAGKERESIGIRNVIRRTKLVHGEEYGLRIRRLEQGTLMTVTLPYAADPIEESKEAPDENCAC